MTRNKTLAVLSAAALSGAASLSAQSSLTGSGLELEIDARGVIQEASLDAVGFWAYGFRNMPIADFNVLLDGQLHYATAAGVDTVGLAQDGGSSSYLGSIGSKLGVARTYSVVENVPVMQVELTFTNVSPDELQLTGREIFDADPGNALGTYSLTYSDLSTLGGQLVAEAWAAGEDDYAVVTGFKTLDTESFKTYVRGSDGGFYDAYSQAELASRDSDGLYADETISLNYALTLAAGESVRIVYLQAFGASLAEAEANFLAALAVEDVSTETLAVEEEVSAPPAAVLPTETEEPAAAPASVYELPPYSVSPGGSAADLYWSY